MYDTILQEVGEFGLYQKRAVVLVCLLVAPNGVSVMSSVFLMAVPDFRCAVPPLTNDTYEIESPWHDELVMSWIPMEENGAFSQCEVHAKDDNDLSSHTNNTTTFTTTNMTTTNTSTKCSRWVYSRDDHTYSLGEKFDIVCDRAFLTTYANLATLLGLMIGSMICGIMADKFGRKTVFMLSILFQIITSFCMLLINTFISYVCVQFLIVTCAVSCYITSFTWIMELVGPSKRALAGMAVMFGWVIGLFVLDFVAYFLRDWTHSCLALPLLFVLLLSYYWILPESPRWLLNKMRTDEAITIIKQIALINNASDFNEERICDLCHQCNADDGIIAKQSSFLSVFKSRTLVMYLGIFSIDWMVVSMVYYGVGLNMAVLFDGDMYMNFFTNACLELVAYIISILTLNLCGRKILFCTGIILSGVACLAAMVPVLAKSKLVWINIVLSNVGRFGVGISWASMYIFTVELFPTDIRNSAIGFCSFIGRIGSLMSPYIGNLHLLVDGQLGKALPLVIFGAAALFAGILSLYLPESNGKRLPENIAEAESMKKNCNDDTLIQ